MKITPYNIKKAVRYLKNYGFQEFFIRLREKGEPEEISYETYRQKTALSDKKLASQRKKSESWKEKPFFSCVLLTTSREEALRNVWEDLLKQQTYSRWEFLAVTDLADGMQQAKGDYLVFVEEGDTLAPQALYELAVAIRNPGHLKQSGVHWQLPKANPDLIYTDEDCQNSEGLFKPDYDPEWLEQECYMKHLCCIRSEAARAQIVPGMDLEFLIRAVALAALPEQILHIPKVLYHSAKPYQMQLEQPEEKVLVEDTPLVSIIIPNKDEADTLRKCIESVKRSSYPAYEVIIVENNSTRQETFDYYKELQSQNENISVVTCEMKQGFNYSYLNNYGVSFAKGKYLVFLNNDIEIITVAWLERMYVQCSKSDVAACGARLYYPDDTIQHAGIMVAVGGHARGVGANMCQGMPRQECGYMGRAARRQSMSAVTAACMMMRADVFHQVGGFTEELAVAFNDVDLCLKVRKAGYRIVYEPAVEAYHYESKSRGQEDTPEKLRRFQEEIEYMRSTWNDIMRGGDPYYNPNLTRVRFDYSLGGIPGLPNRAK